MKIETSNITTEMNVGEVVNLDLTLGVSSLSGTGVWIKIKQPNSNKVEIVIEAQSEEILDRIIIKKKVIK